MTASSLTNLDMIRLFLAEDESLEINPDLRIQSTLYARQLLDKNGQVVASIPISPDSNQSPKLVSVHSQSAYVDLTVQVLQELGFVPSAKLKRSGFVTYQQRNIPAGYSLKLTEARILWRNWWTRQRVARKTFGLEMDLLVLARDNWYPVQDIACNQGTLFIKTLVGEVALQGADQVVWLEKQVGSTAAREVVQQRVAAKAERRTAQATGQSESISVPPPAPQPLRSSDPAATRIQSVPTQTSIPVPPPSASDYPSGGLRSPASHTAAQSAAVNIPSNWGSVIRHSGNRLYIKTELGYITVEGAHLQVECKSHPRSTPAAAPASAPSSTKTVPITSSHRRFRAF